MRLFPALVFAFLSSPALGQITILSVDRRVESLAWINYNYVDSDRLDLGVQDLELRDNPIEQVTHLDPFSALVTATVESPVPLVPAGATITAWQESTISDTAIIVRGGVRDADRHGGANGSQGVSARSVMEIVFSIGRNNRFALSGDLVQPPMQVDGSASSLVILTGDVFYSLTGPETMFADPPLVVVDNLQPIADTPQRFERTEIITPGTYTLTVSARSSDNPSIAAHWVTFRDVSYDVRLDVVHVPEPSTWVLVIAGAVSLHVIRLLRRRRSG